MRINRLPALKLVCQTFNNKNTRCYKTSEQQYDENSKTLIALLPKCRLNLSEMFKLSDFETEKGIPMTKSRHLY